MIKRHKKIVCMIIMIMLLFSHSFPSFAGQGTGSITHVVIKIDENLVIISIGAYGMALADGPGNEIYDYIADGGTPLVKAIGSGDKFINIGAYADALADTANVPDAIEAAPALGQEATSTYKIFKGFGESGEPILEPLFGDIVYKSTEAADFDVTVSLGTTAAEVISQLDATVGVIGTNDEQGTASINWTLNEGYDGDKAGEYSATGVLTLPDGWSGTPDEVVATVTVLQQKYTVTFTDPTYGSLGAAVEGDSIASGDQVEEGKSIVFTVVPGEGYIVAGWSVNGLTVPNEDDLTYTHHNIDEDITVAVILEEEPVTPEGLVLWLDATYYDAITGVWPDMSGVNNTVEQTSTDNRPSRANPEGLGGRPAVRFNGSSQYLDHQWNMENGSLTAGGITMFMVLKSENMEDSQTVMGNYGEKGDVCFHISTRQNTLTAAVTHSNDEEVRLPFSESLEPYIATYKVTSTNHTAYVDGVQTSTGDLGESINWGATTIGRNGGPVGNNIEEWHWEGYIAEIRIYDYAMDDWERELIEQELSGKWFGPYNPEPISAVHFVPVPGLREGTGNVAVGATVGTLSASDGIGSITYSLANGEGDTHNDRLRIEGNAVKVKSEALIEGTYSFRVKGQDDQAQVEHCFSITVLEEPEPIDVFILNNPYNEVDWDTVNQYKANFHTHTNQSDGDSEPDAVIKAYADAGYSILALTDHDAYSYDPDTTWPWTEWISQEPEPINYRNGEEDEEYEKYETSAQYTGLGTSGDRTILAVRGNELSNTHHTGSLFSEYGGAGSGQEYAAMDEISNRNGLAILNHPGRENKTDQWYADIYTQYQGTLFGMEVYNQGDRYSGDRKLWDRVNTMLMPDNAVWGYSNDDMHQINSHTFRNYQFMLMKELTEEDLRNALLTGASYFCYEPGRGVTGGEFAGDHQVPLIEEIVVTDTDEVTIIEIDVCEVNTADTITWRTNKGVIGTGDSIDLTQLDLDEDIFIRAELENDYGRTYTQPFILGYGPLEEIPVTGVSIIEEDQTLGVGDTLQLTAAIAPANATEKGVSWSSDNEDVASVNGSGLVTAVSEGAAAITVTTDEGGYTDAVTITVVASAEFPVDGLVLHLDAADYNEGTGVWTDRSGSNNIVAQVESDYRPTKVGNGLNDLPVVRFDGSNQHLDLDWNLNGSSAFTTDFTIFMVMKNKNMSGGTQVVMGNYNSDNEVSISISSQGDNPLVGRITSYSHSCDFTTAPGPYVLTYDYDSSMMRTFVDGESTDTHNTDQSINWGDTAIGCSGTGDERYWSGDIAEIIVYDSVLSDNDRQAVEQYLNHKWFGEPVPEPISAIHFTAAPGLREGTDGVAAGATVGTLSATDGIGSITYSLISGENDDNNDSFIIDENEVKVAEKALTEGTYNFRVKGEDEEENEEEGSFTILVLEKVEFPVDGLVLHLDAADYNEETGVWTDRSGSNNIVAQVESDYRPTKVGDGLNGLPVVRFDGSNQHLDLDWNLNGSSAFTTGFTIFMVMKNKNMSGGTQVVMGNYNSDNEVSISISSQGDRPLVGRITSYSHSCTFTTEPGPYVLTYDYNSSTMRTFVDGGLTDTHNTDQSINWKDTAIGRSGTGDPRYWSGDIAEIMIYDSVLSDEERAVVEQKLLIKYEL